VTRRRIAVIGGGIAGTSVAAALGQTHDVVLFEREAELGAQATGRSAATLSETSGLRLVCALARASRAFLEAPPAGFAEHPLSGPRGLLWIGRDGDEGTLDAIAAMAASGVAPTARRVDAVAAIALVPALRPAAVAAGGVWEPDARSLDVAGLLAGYARAARATGVELRCRAEVRELRATGAGWAVQWTAGVQGATGVDHVDVVVNAAGAWGDVIAARAGLMPIGLQPLRRTASIVAAPAEVASWPLVMDVAGRCYFEPEAGGLLLSPGDEHPSAPADVAAEMEDVAWSLDVLAEVTTLEVRHVRRSWAGLRTFTPDRAPAVGWAVDGPGFLWLVGQGGAGIKTAPAMAAVAAAIVDDGPWPDALTELGVGPADLAPARFAPRQNFGRL
jgi:D-arginine dehydrogenase